jgi:sugar lactone lactonase YvrE
MTEIACVVACKNKLGEMPVWDVDEQALYWVDIENKLLRRYIPAAGEARRWTLPERIGSFALRSVGASSVRSPPALRSSTPAPERLTGSTSRRHPKKPVQRW